MADAATNETARVVSDFYITTDKWVQFYSNKVLFFGSIVGVIAVITSVTGVIFVVARKRRKSGKE